MGRKIRIRKATPSTSTDTSTSAREWKLKGKPIQVGDLVLIKHYSSAKWEKAVVKEIKESASGKATFFFFIPSPGWVALTEDRIKFIPKTRIKRTKGEVNDTEN